MSFGLFVFAFEFFVVFRPDMSLCVLAIMSEAMRDQVSAHLISRHVPNTWKDKTRIHAPSPTLSEQEKSEADFSGTESDFQQWRALLGKDSGKFCVSRFSVLDADIIILKLLLT